MNEDYFIFADKVYDIHKVLANHPGGYELIKSIRGREVDRYIYGTEPLELFHDKMFLHRHTSNALSLAGSPIGILASVNPYTSMEDTNKCYVHSTKKLNVANMYVPYLASKNSLCSQLNCTLSRESMHVGHLSSSVSWFRHSSSTIYPHQNTM